MTEIGPATTQLLAAILADVHRYQPGLDQGSPASPAPAPAPGRRWAAAGQPRARTRDRAERAAARAGFSRRHFDPASAAGRLAWLLERSAALEAAHAALADGQSRRRLLDLLEHRVLGPYHAPAAITPDAYRAMQADADARLLLERDTFTVTDPWFPALSRYRVPGGGGCGRELTLHAHSISVVGVFLLEQYRYAHGGAEVGARPGDVVLDVGGGWGDSALYFAAAVGPAGRVYTFELEPGNLAVLRANLALNPELAQRIEVVELAVWDRSGRQVAFSPAGASTRVSGEATAGAPGGAAGGATGIVETVTIDEFVAARGLDRVDLVKLDIEGAERRALDGAGGTLARFKPSLALSAYHREDDLFALPAAIAGLGLGYRLYLDTFSAIEDETVLFAARPEATARSSST